jgi:hypothetical protein
MQQQAARARYGHAMAGFVAWLGAHWDELKAAATHEAAADGEQLRSEPLDEDLRVIGSAEGDLLGWHDRDTFWFLPSFSYNFVAAYCKREGRYFGTKELALRKALADEGLLMLDEGRTTTPKRIDGHLHRLLKLSRRAVENTWSLS